MIYLDHAATTPISKSALEMMTKMNKKYWANPGSLHQIGQLAHLELTEARRKIAKILNCDESEIVFTSGGTESNNLLIKGLGEIYQKGHIISSQVEHHAVLYPLEDLEKKGFQVTYLQPDQYGLISAEKVQKSIRKNTILISVMYANNEVGTINPIKEIGEIAKKNNIFFHTDAVQAAGFLDLNVEKLQVDALTLSGHKFYGPKGVGALFLKKGSKIKPQLLGGGQEQNLRASTENLPAIAAMALALEDAFKNQKKENKRLIELRDFLYENLKKNIPEIKLNGSLEKRLPNNLNISFARVEGESILLYLDQEKIFVSTGSACTSGSLDPSHVLKAMNVPAELMHGSIRFSLGKMNQKKDIKKTVEVLTRVINKLREMSPLK